MLAGLVLQSSNIWKKNENYAQITENINYQKQPIERVPENRRT